MSRLVMFAINLSCLCSSSALRLTKNLKTTRALGSARLQPLKAGKIEYEDFEEIDGLRLNTSPPISWYPGHIAKAERELADYLKKVDVVIEVRDARIPLSTTHPMVPEWVGNKPLIVAIARIDQVSKKALEAWREYYTMNPPHASRPDAKVYFIDGKLGAGVLTLKKQALKAGVAINERREKRGIQPRAVRAAIIGFPNVGKSALINRLLGKKMAKSRNLPGVTKSLMWVRLGSSSGLADADQTNMIELLDSPGIIPARQLDQEGALKLAICNDIGEASYDRVVVAAAMCDRLIKLSKSQKGYVDMRRINDRYEIQFDEMTGEEIVYEIAEKFYQGNSVSASDKLLGDFRKGFMGYCSLEAPAAINREKEEKDAKKLAMKIKAAELKAAERLEFKTGDQIKADAIGLPKIGASSLDVGKGDYEGW
mmetsp:Transcript_19604/g.18941  ORF Transcript_19604/g.18941 Transcript_19604/m.18941 type:complete len:425 (+) Transcript_19604:89-1363(+)|eukprot:CAMPEP_0119040706 /NCGR_PEP_ID=MMETSP1177-20130426/10715_1 /TAXON_ID=2985 /ORGANISM="Ochromonas sp, Strain CCMP1899" /LENGTH=424 /DNA_ID=CAMNT_0007006017 /DNA_START=88 /DNA_END=1362 /DNA_ORIENTATION=-